ncbi:hypothetical protein BOX15_Mlig018356g1 [Macrostomum lignano]|uniref:UspA domain-containing protein n=1 Tax=Macrostomum lignano TaxID=282301 RepID=A0A267G981_9PLAT|nr:hypothetical protein BOX15_Mlig018356g1 [Macrostomum lignano]
MSQQSTMSITLAPNATELRLVLIPVDRSRNSERALAWYAGNLAQRRDQVLFVNVSEPPEVSSATQTGLAGAQDVYQRAIGSAIEKGRELAEQVRRRWMEFGMHRAFKEPRFLERLSKDPGPAICQVAKDEGVNLIVIGSRGMSRLKRTFLGSVSEYVLHHAKVPIAIVPPPKQQSLEAIRQASQDTASGDGQE